MAMSIAPRRSADRVTAASGSVVTKAMNSVPTKLRFQPAAWESWSARWDSQMPAARTTAAARPKRRSSAASVGMRAGVSPGAKAAVGGVRGPADGDATGMGGGEDPVSQG
jgi:hypothetical protein